MGFSHEIGIREVGEIEQPPTACRRFGIETTTRQGNATPAAPPDLRATTHDLRRRNTSDLEDWIFVGACRVSRNALGARAWMVYHAFLDPAPDAQPNWALLHVASSSPTAKRRGPVR